MLEPSAKTGSGAPCAEFRLSKGCLPTTVLLPASRMTCRTSMSATCKSLEPWSSPRATFSTLELRAHSPMRAVQSVLPPRGEKRETAARRRDACPSLRRFVPGAGDRERCCPWHPVPVLLGNGRGAGCFAVRLGRTTDCWRNARLRRAGNAEACSVSDGWRLSSTGMSRDIERHQICVATSGWDKGGGDLRFRELTFHPGR